MSVKIERILIAMITLLLITGIASGISSVDQGFQASWFIGDMANGTLGGLSLSSLISSLQGNDTVDRTYVNDTFLPIVTYAGDFPNSSVAGWGSDFPNSTIESYAGDYPNSTLVNYLPIATYAGDYPNSTIVNYLLITTYNGDFPNSTVQNNLATWNSTYNSTYDGYLALINALQNNDTVDRTYVNDTFLPIATYGTNFPNNTISGYIGNVALLDENNTFTATGNNTFAGNVNVTGDYLVDGIKLNSSHILDHNEHTVADTFEHIVNRGKSQAITIGLTGGLGVNWTAGEIYDGAGNTFESTDAGSDNLNDNTVNYLKWTGTSTLQIATSTSSGDDILIATFSVYDGVINGHREHSLISESIADTRRGLRIAFPNRIISGMSITEDVDVTNPLDISMAAGVVIKDGIELETPSAIDSRTINLIRHYHTAGAWDFDTNAEIDTTNYDNGTGLEAIPAGKYVKSYFIFMNGKIGWVYPTEYFNTIAQAEAASLSAIPPGLNVIPKLTAIVYQQGDIDFADAIWQDIRPGISEEIFNVVTDHGSLVGLGDNDHPQYLLTDTYSGDFPNSTIVNYLPIATYNGNFPNLTVSNNLDTWNATYNSTYDALITSKVNKTDAGELSGGTLPIARLDEDIVYRSIQMTMYNSSGAIATGMKAQIFNVPINGTIETLELQNGLGDGNFNISVLKTSSGIPELTDIVGSVNITAGSTASETVDIDVVYGDRLKFYVDANAGYINSTTISLRIRTT